MTTADFTYSVPGISCGHCKAAIERGVTSVADVAAVEVDVDTKMVMVTGGDEAAIVAAIVDAGYEVAV